MKSKDRVCVYARTREYTYSGHDIYLYVRLFISYTFHFYTTAKLRNVRITISPRPFKKKKPFADSNRPNKRSDTHQKVNRQYRVYRESIQAIAEKKHQAPSKIFIRQRVKWAIPDEVALESSSGTRGGRNESAKERPR